MIPGRRLRRHAEVQPRDKPKMVRAEIHSDYPQQQQCDADTDIFRYVAERFPAAANERAERHSCFSNAEPHIPQHNPFPDEDGDIATQHTKMKCVGISI
jgi:hypothetical protein